jgi:hypothetical protein
MQSAQLAGLASLAKSEAFFALQVGAFGVFNST